VTHLSADSEPDLDCGRQYAQSWAIAESRRVCQFASDSEIDGMRRKPLVGGAQFPL